MPIKPTWENEEEILLEEDLEHALDSELACRIVVYNDDVNTFEWVIECFMEILGHTSVQSEQLAIIIHTKGKATVKTGPRAELEAPTQALSERGLSAVLEEG